MINKYAVLFKTLFFLLLTHSAAVGLAQSKKDSLSLPIDFESFIQKNWNQGRLLFSKNQWQELTQVLGFGSLSPKQLVKKPKINLRVENFWSLGDSLLYSTSAMPAMTYFSPEIQAEVLGIPFVTQGNLVFRGQQFEQSLSSFRVQFDYHRFLEQKKQALQQKVLDATVHQWTAAEKKCWENKLKWDALYPIVTHPEFVKLKQQWGEVIDTLETKQAALKSGAEASLARLNTLKTEYEKYNSIDKSFRELFHYYEKNHEAMAQAEALKERVQAAEKQAEQGLATFKNGDKTVKNQSSKWIQQQLSAVKGLDIGTFDVVGSDLTLRNMTVNGGHVVLEANKRYYEVAFGKQSTATPIYRMGFNPIYGAGDLNRYVLYLRSGWGGLDSTHLHVSLARIIDHFKGASLFGQSVRPKFNDVLAIAGKQPLSKKVELSTEYAYSIYRSDVVQAWGIQQDFKQQTDVSPLQFAAFQLKLGSPERLAATWKWSLGYSYIGNQYISLGNPFLMNNRQLIRADFHQTFFNNALKVKLGFDKQLAAGNTMLTPAIDQTGWRIESSLKYGGNQRLTVQIMPRYYLLSASGSPNAIARYDVYNIQNTVQGKIGGSRWLSMVHLTNMNMTIPMGDTVRFTGLNYFFTQNQWLPSEQWVLSLMGNLGLQGRWADLHRREATLQADVRWQHSKMSLLLGGQSFAMVTPRSEIQAGIVFGGSFKWAYGSFGFQSQLRTRLGAGDQPYLFSGQSFWNIHF
jgi:hypothetical protein